MISTQNTPNLTGVTISGDYLDFQQLYDSLHDILPMEGEDTMHEEARMRVLSFCYDLRHALMGHREFTYVENGLNDDKMHLIGAVGSTKNIYFAFNTLYPELLFVMMALNYYTENAKYKGRQPGINPSVVVVKNLQTSVLTCLDETLSPQKFLNTIRSINQPKNLSNYVTQYVDLLNLRYLDWDKEKREKNISIIAKRLSEQGDEYQEVKNEVHEAASEYNCRPDQIRLEQDYPDEIDW
ncbi:DUF6904 family protein [Tenuibacillus multivorans]|uniref:Uncharacterized protein n=1 Tax=Tenuibacillus multivorans TaxID=237069 RepID=A0A1H0BS75_9BACI|nr:hypothetical protein [Tenuibacillus multivorans]GEL77053.1 hypothetical protein TMU01_12880 [Tenuibacillus multivorans]SDN48509.1 hypothetical protein SAMN05216498_2368 [Tenuibacillus multivorans]